MAHESSVHRFDAQNAFGVRQPIDAELAADGLDELIDIVAKRIYTRDNLTGPTGSVVLESADAGTWSIALERDGISRVDIISNPDVTVRGTSNILLLAAYGRTQWSGLDVTGDIALLESWSAAMNF
jgi:hypothetical protein